MNPVPLPLLAIEGAEPPPFCCPGERQPIPAAVHRARLAAGYPACRGCPRNPLPPPTPPRLTHDSAARQWSLEGVWRNEIDISQVREFAGNLARLARREGADREAPTLLLAYDGRPQAAEALAEAAELYLQAGCRVLHGGAVPLGGFHWALSPGTGWELAAGLLVGNPSGEPHRLSLRGWVRGGMEERGGGKAADSPARRGRLEWIDLPSRWRAHLAPWFHGLRPLRVELATTNHPLCSQVEQLIRGTALRVRPHRSRGPAPERLEAVSAAGAHLGFWADGDGGAWRLYDERGNGVPETAARALLRTVHDPSAQGVSPSSDALTALTHLLAALSREDRPVSRRVAAS